MMVRKITFLVALLLGFSSFSQRLWVLPYYPDMYNNGAAKQIIKTSKISYEELNSRISNALTEHIEQLFSDTVTIISLNQSTTEEEEHPVESAWGLLTYAMNPIPAKNVVIVGAHSRLSSKNNKSKKPSGELRPVIRSTNNLFLDSKITNKKSFAKITHHLKCNYVLVINEFDIKVDYSDPYATGRNDNKRQIQIHYSLFDKSGNHIAGNVAAVNFSSHENNINAIINNYFGKLAQQIFDYIKF
jgi:hypothetical protein